MHDFPFRKVLVANRSEIAVRIIRAARDAGLASVAIYADPDKDAPYTEMADEAIGIGGETSSQSYLDIDIVLKACRDSGADAVHPGYGFLSENAEFAQKVIDAQGPEIERMNAMLTAWGQDPVDTDGMDGMEGMDHGGMSGMMSEEDMAALEQAQGTEAARLYLEQMTAHHKGAVDMAKDEAKDGQNPQAVQLAEQVIADQEAEITEMQQMLDKL